MTTPHDRPATDATPEETTMSKLTDTDQMADWIHLATIDCRMRYPTKGAIQEGLANAILEIERLRARVADETNQHNTTIASGPFDPRPSELRSIASSVEPAFPTAAETLRAIADTLEATR